MRLGAFWRSDSSRMQNKCPNPYLLNFYLIQTKKKTNKFLADLFYHCYFVVTIANFSKEAMFLLEKNGDSSKSVGNLARWFTFKITTVALLPYQS